MGEVITIGLDIAKSVFHAHGADAAGRQVFSRRIARGKVLEFFGSQPRCLVALEACGGSHHWAHGLAALEHEVRLIPPAYVKPFVKRHKNDAAPFDCLQGRRSGQGCRGDLLEEELGAKIAELDKQIARRSREDVVARRLMTIPGIGPIAATAIAALTPPLEGFAKGRDFAAWLGLTPLQKSTGGRQKLGRTSKMGERTIRRLLIIGASAVVQHAARRGVPEGSWLAGMLARKPRMLVTVAQANKTARIVWAVLTKEQDYRALAAAA